jgi:hypothetical protein
MRFQVVKLLTKNLKVELNSEMVLSFIAFLGDFIFLQLSLTPSFPVLFSRPVVLAGCYTP